MSNDLSTSLTHTRPAPETEAPKKGTRSRPVKVRKHTMSGVSSRDLAAFLDKLHVDGGFVVCINQSLSVGGNYEVVSYTEE